MNILLYSRMGRGKGGAETVFKNIADGLEKRGHKVDRLYYTNRLNSGSYKKLTNGYGMNLFMPAKLKLFLHPKFVYRFFASLVGIYMFLNKTKPEVINYHFYGGSSFYFALLKRIFGYRLVISCHGSDVNKIRGMHYLLAPFVMKTADLVTGVSDLLLQKLKRQIPGNYNTQVIYNGIDYDFWSRSDSNSEDQKLKKNLSIVSVGAFTKVKGHDILINAFDKVVKSYSEKVSLTLIGDGPRRNNYTSLIKSKGLSKQIRITGWLSSKEIRKELSKASLFVLPSRQEGFGLALVEAMAAGLPIIASHTGGIPEILGEINAFLVTPESHDELVDAIIKAINSPQWRYVAGKEAKIQAKQFKWESTLSHYEFALGLRQ